MSHGEPGSTYIMHDWSCCVVCSDGIVAIRAAMGEKPTTHKSLESPHQSQFHALQIPIGLEFFTQEPYMAPLRRNYSEFACDRGNFSLCT